MKSLPVFPGAELVEMSSSPYYEEGDPVPRGYSTSATYRVSADVEREDIVEYYVEELQTWEDCVEEVQVPITQAPLPAGVTPAPMRPGQTSTKQVTVLMAGFMQDRASISVDTRNIYVAGRNTFGVTVDHDAVINRCTGERLR